MKLSEISGKTPDPLRPTIFRRIHSLGPPVPCASTQKPRVRVERLPVSVKLQKECDRVTL